jgi:hypothetical protein
MANIFVAAAATWNGKALKTAKKDVSVFDKQVKKLGTTLLGVFSARALYNYSKNAVKAFAADEKAARSLEVQLKNTGFAFSSPGVELYISNLQRATGVLDDELRPAFQQLLTVTGSIGKSQDALNTALNVAAGTGKSLSQVTQALSRAYAGNTQGLSRLGAGLNKTLLKAGDMDEIMAELNKKFSGQAAARLTTYSGKMDLLKVASENVKEEIGKGIIGALEALGEDTNIEKATKQMEEYGRTTGDTIRGLGVFVKTLSDIPGIGLVGKAFYETSTLGLLARLGKENRPARELPANEQRSSSRIYVQQLKQEKRVADQLAKARAEELRLLGIKNGIENKNVKELEKKFDLERIGITQALNAATDDETKLRLRAQLAILDNNEALAKKLLAEMEAAEALKKLAEAVNKATDSLVTAFDLLSKAVKDLIISFGVSPSQVGPGGTITATAGGGRMGSLADVAINNPEFGYSNEARALGLALGFTPGISMGGSGQEMRVTVDVAGAGDKLSQAIAESIQVATRNGYSTVPAGQGF